MSTGTVSAGPAGVRNLRAMFENKSNDQTTSPPSRGRSPNGSVSSQPSRQVSKVRTSFVAVERPGESSQSPQWAIRKTSDVSSMAESREQAIMEESNNAVTDSATQETPMSAIDGAGLGAILKGSPFEASPSTATETPPSRSTTAPIPTAKQSPEKPQPNRTESKSKVASLVGKMQTAAQPKVKTEPVSDTKSTRPAPATLNTKTTASKPKESPTLSKKSPTLQKKDSAATVNGNGTPIKPRGGVNKITGIIQSSNRAKEERAKAEQSKSTTGQEEKKTIPKEIKVPSVASKPTAASKAHAQKEDKMPSIGEQIKSPVSTRLHKLPSAATAGTAASAARKGNSSADEENRTSASERKSTLPQAPRVANASTRASLAKKSSRASLANGEDRPRSRVSTAHKQADDGFLARMTRPTASSARRAQEKTQVTSPPRVRQSSANQDIAKKPARRSISTNLKPAPAADETNETILDPVNEDAHGSGNGILDDQDEGEPGPAEEDTVIEPSQPAEVDPTTL